MGQLNDWYKRCFRRVLVDMHIPDWNPELLDGTNDGDNFINTRIDDSSVHDLWAAGDEAAPFTGDWLPHLNSPSLVENSYYRSIDPVGQLSHFIGQSTRGTWQVRVEDYMAGEAGTLNSWSLIVTPVAYQCGP